jgi:P-type E1-E2 ATPase
MNLLAIRENLQNLNEMASNHGKCLVFRTEYQKEVDNSEIVPGDVISLSSNCKVPADCILIEGSVLINESSLTGESLPIQKQRPPNEEELIKSGKKYIIMEGTIV